MKKIGFVLYLTTSAFAVDEVKSWFEGIQFKGFAFARYSGVNGANGYGDRYHYRFKIDAKSEEINGYSLTAGLYLNQGSSTPQSPEHNTHGDVQGSQAIAAHNQFPDRFAVAQLYASKNITTDSMKFSADVGRMNLITSFTEKATDVGLGARGSFKFSSVEFGIAFYDSWATNNFAYAFNAMKNKPLVGSAPASASWGMGNNLTIVNLKTPKNNKIADLLSVDVSIGNAIGLFDVLAFGELRFDWDKVYLLVQGAGAKMNNTPYWQIGQTGSTNAPISISTWENTHTFPTYSGFDNSNFAKNRGIYNIQLGAKFGGFSAKLGYLGSFGDGYGVLLASKAGLNIAGKTWNNNLNSSSEGFSVLGSGRREGTSIMVGYAAAELKVTEPLKIGFDLSYVAGDNNYAYLGVARAPDLTTNAKGIKFFELAPSLSYAFNKKLKANLFYAQYLGDVTYGKTRAEIRFDF
ncbi:hypothetical protein [uncultured Helicobacter sp.]|uniref:hypothetical protein n=1 Tax=uncultured Helicobacter sp. TaxID=175537 RepID=UPI00260B5CB9|nr:hypothetical protein [uncultured Helicobacter sp.]